jgi:hypothetical protein
VKGIQQNEELREGMDGDMVQLKHGRTIGGFSPSYCYILPFTVSSCLRKFAVDGK